MNFMTLFVGITAASAAIGSDMNFGVICHWCKVQSFNGLPTMKLCRQCQCTVNRNRCGWPWDGSMLYRRYCPVQVVPMRYQLILVYTYWLILLSYGQVRIKQTQKIWIIWAVFAALQIHLPKKCSLFLFSKIAFDHISLLISTYYD